MPTETETAAQAVPAAEAETAAAAARTSGEPRPGVRSFGLARREALILGLVVAVAAVMRFYLLDRYPNEIYGDIATIFGYLDGILAGRWPFHFALSVGPLYPYVLSVFTSVLGETYFGVRIASVLLGLGTVVAIYLLARELLGEASGYLAAFVAAVSSWLVIYNRLGDVQTLVPLEVAVMLACAFGAMQRSSLPLWLAAFAVSVLGLYTYAAAFVLPVTVLALAGLHLLISARDRGVTAWALTVGVLILGVGAVPYLTIPSTGWADAIAGGYLSSKAVTDDPNAPGVPVLFWNNLTRALSMFHLTGDANRHGNVPLEPHIDQVSGALLLLGLAALVLMRRGRVPLLYLLTAFAILLLPSVSVLGRPAEVPSASRSIGVMPVVAVVIGFGIYALACWVATRVNRRVGVALAVVLCAAILAENWDRYFTRHIEALPGHGVAYAAVVADYVDTLPADTKVTLLGCCWGPYGQLEPQGVEYSVRQRKRVVYADARAFNCASVDRRVRNVFVFDPKDDALRAALQQCGAPPPRVERVGDADIFAAADLPAR